MKFIVEKEAEGAVFAEPYARTIKSLAAPWTLGTTQVWLATDEIQPYNGSDPHKHEDKEEIFFFLSGKGKVRVDREEIRVEPGYCVFCPMGSVHEVINDTGDILRFVAVVAPPFAEKIGPAKK